MVTCALATAAPVGSVTVPVIVAVSCAKRAAGHSTHARKSNRNSIDFILVSSAMQMCDTGERHSGNAETPLLKRINTGRNPIALSSRKFTRTLLSGNLDGQVESRGTSSKDNLRRVARFCARPGARQCLQQPR